MDDILPLLNINIPYNNRIEQINYFLNQSNNYLELNLTVVSSTLTYDKNTYIITPKGLQNSKRNPQDGIVLFGYERNNNKKNENKILNSDNTNPDNNIYSRNNLNSETFNDEYSKDFLLNDFSFPIEEKDDNFSLYERLSDKNE